jgi:plasmid maintenance system antidote protein VapI
MNQRLKDLIKELKRQRKILNQAELAQLANISRTQFSELVTGSRKISDRAIHKISSTFPEINEEWLRTGQGEMLKNSASAGNNSMSIAGEEIKGNKITVNNDNTIALLVAEMAAQRRLTEKVLEQNSELIAVIAGKKKNGEL